MRGDRNDDQVLKHFVYIGSACRDRGTQARASKSQYLQDLCPAEIVTTEIADELALENIPRPIARQKDRMRPRYLHASLRDDDIEIVADLL